MMISRFCLLLLLSFASASAFTTASVRFGAPAFQKDSSLMAARSKTQLRVGVSYSADYFYSSAAPVNSTTTDYYNYRDNVQEVAAAGAWTLPRPWSSPATSTTRQQQRRRHKVFCDLDGVLVDFEHGIRQIFPEHPEVHNLQIQDLHRPTMWERVANSNRFFEHLPWTRQGRRLWEAIRHLEPDILTGVPTYHGSRTEKFNWCRRELGLEEIHHVDMAGHWRNHVPVGGQRRSDVCNVITCWSDNKHVESKQGHVLIDDRIELKENWEVKGGIFIHHTDGKLEETLQELKRHGIL